MSERRIRFRLYTGNGGPGPVVVVRSPWVPEGRQVAERYFRRTFPDRWGARKDGDGWFRVQYDGEAP